MILKYEQERDKKLVFTIIDRRREILDYVFFFKYFKIILYIYFKCKN